MKLNFNILVKKYHGVILFFVPALLSHNFAYFIQLILSENLINISTIDDIIDIL